MKLILILFTLLWLNNSFADWKNTAENVWEETISVTNDVIDFSKNASGKLLSNKEENPASTGNSQASKKMDEIWDDVLEHLDDGLVVFDKIKAAPESSYFSEDKKSLREDFNAILDDIVILLDDKKIKDYRDKIDLYQQQIAVRKGDISKYHEKRVIAPQEHISKTTKKDYEDKIYQSKQDIENLESEIEVVKLDLIEQLKLVGLELDLNQVTVLLSRVDADNIIQMSVVFNVLKQITKQLVELTQSNGEEVKSAKRYYGMNVVLIEMVIYMQDNYIKQINDKFLPKIKAINEKTALLHKSTQKQISQETDKSRKNIYQQNLQAQKLTMKVAHLYMNNLKNQRKKVITAKNKALKDFKLANNTYETVELSADLVTLLNSSQKSFDVIMSLQVPEIVPFESIEMRKKYQELSELIKEMDS